MNKLGMGLGGAVVSNNILKENARIKWIIREDPVDDLDNGWRFFSEIDTDIYLSDSRNMSICDWGTLINIEPAILPIYNMPIGTELTLVYDGDKKIFIDPNTGENIF